MPKLTLRNDRCFVQFDEDAKEIFGRDLTDGYNGPAFYNKTKRGLKTAWASIEKCFCEQTTMHDLMAYCDLAGVRTHYWCMVD